MKNEEKWGPGPWDDEPDREVWVDEATDLDCLIRRNRLGLWCGYVGVPETHPLHGLDYHDAQIDEIDVHGGLTYADECDDDPEGGICHVPSPGHEEDVWWFGFDCGHFGDLTPYAAKTERDHGWESTMDAHYWTVDEVRAETLKLARQLTEVGK